MKEKHLLGELDKRANVRTFHGVCKSRDVPVVLFEDHRYTLNVLWCAYELGLLDRSSPPNLVRFDYHDDGRNPQCGTDRLQAIRAKPPTLRSFMDFVEWELSVQDDDWVKVAMELGLVKDVINFGGVRNHNFGSEYQEYKDHAGGRHSVWTLSHLWDQFGYQAPLSDLAQRARFGRLWSALGWDPQDGTASFGGPPKFVLDIDLDCFTGRFCDVQMAFPTEVLRKKLEDYVEGYSPREFLRRIAMNSAFVSLAIESDCCGGLDEAIKVLKCLDTVLFDVPCLV